MTAGISAALEQRAQRYLRGSDSADGRTGNCRLRSQVTPIAVQATRGNMLASNSVGDPDRRQTLFEGDVSSSVGCVSPVSLAPASYRREEQEFRDRDPKVPPGSHLRVGRLRAVSGKQIFP